MGYHFVSTKVLINEGLSPVEILLYHFILAYSCIWIILHGKLWANCPKDELLLFLAGLCGGSLYFIAENTVLGITPTSNICPEHCNTTERIRIIWKNAIVKLFGIFYYAIKTIVIFAYQTGIQFGYTFVGRCWNIRRNIEFSIQIKS